MSNVLRNQERLIQLLADQTTQGLLSVELQELEALLDANPDIDAHGLERAAAAVHVAMLPPDHERLPVYLRDRVLTDARRFFGAPSDHIAPDHDSSPTPKGDRGRLQQRRLIRAGLFLVAASLALAVAGWWQVLVGPSPSTRSAPEQLAEFVREASDVVRVPWSGKEPSYQDVSGEVVWSGTRQRGFMRLVGLTPNDPAVSQYQLWIVDPNRDKHPVDGGVFDIETDGEVILPFGAKLRIDAAETFAVTLEKPGGVVVSDGPLLIVGSVSG